MTQQPQYPQYGPGQPTPQGPQGPGPQGPSKPPGAPKPPRKWVAWAGGGMVGLLAGLVIGTAGGGDATNTSPDPQPTVTVTQPAPAVETTAPPPAPATTEPPAPPKATAPTVKDFKLTVKTLTKQCFGSAGCNVTFRILVTYNGPALDPGKTYEVLYTVKGGEDPLENKLTVTGDQSSVDEEEMVQTAKSTAKLTAVVTDVSES